MRWPHQYTLVTLAFLISWACVVEAQPQRRQGPQDGNQQGQRSGSRGQGRRRGEQNRGPGNRQGRGQGQRRQQFIAHPVATPPYRGRAC